MVNQHFGHAYSAVAAALVDADELQLGELARDARLTADEVRPVLMVLLKNNVVEYFEKKVGAGCVVVYYKLNVENVINLALYPRYLSFFEDRFSILARSITESMMLGGTLTMPECIQITRDNAGLELEGEDINESDYIQEFGTLVSLNYLVPVHKPISLLGIDLSNYPGESNGNNLSSSIGKRKPEISSASKGKKVKSSKNFLVEDSLAAGKLIDL